MTCDENVERTTSAVNTGTVSLHSFIVCHIVLVFCYIILVLLKDCNTHTEYPTVSY